MIPRTIVLVAERFTPRLSASRVGVAVARGLRDSGPYEVECHPREDPETPPREKPRASVLASLWEDVRLHEARALVLADPELCSGLPPRDASFELATRARQGGVPAYALTGVRSPDLFQARMLDLQVVLFARGAHTLERAGAALAELI